MITKILLSFLFLISLELQAQSRISVAQKNFIQSRAASKVKTYTEYLELLGRKDGKSVDEKNQIKETIYLSFASEKGLTRIYNDLIPADVQAKYQMAPSIQLSSYLDQLNDIYPQGAEINFSNFITSEVYYNQIDNWFFVKITTDKKLKGPFEHTAIKKVINESEKTDFFVSATLSNGKIKMGGIYGIQPHTEKKYFEAVVVNEGEGGISPVGKPLAIPDNMLQRKYIRGKTYDISWTGGLADDIINIELLPQDTVKTKKQSFTSMLNANKFLFTPSIETPVGNYKFQINNISTDGFVQTGMFKIRRKVPLGLVIAVPVCTAGIITALIIANAEKKGTITISNDIADPPNPGE